VKIQKKKRKEKKGLYQQKGRGDGAFATKKKRPRGFSPFGGGVGEEQKKQKILKGLRSRRPRGEMNMRGKIQGKSGGWGEKGFNDNEMGAGGKKTSDS